MVVVSCLDTLLPAPIIIVSTSERQDGPSLILVVETDDLAHSPRGHKKLYYSHTEVFWESKADFQSWSKNGLRKQWKEMEIWVFMVVRLWIRVRIPTSGLGLSVWTSHWQQREHLGFLISFLDVGRSSGKRGVRLSSHQQTSKSGGILLQLVYLDHSHFQSLLIYLD